MSESGFQFTINTWEFVDGELNCEVAEFVAISVSAIFKTVFW